MIIIATTLQKMIILIQKNSYLFSQEVTIAVSSRTRWDVCLFYKTVFCYSLNIIMQTRLENLLLLNPFDAYKEGPLKEILFLAPIEKTSS